MQCRNCSDIQDDTQRPFHPKDGKNWTDAARYAILLRKGGEGMRILLVEDEKPLSAAIVKLLERRQFLVDPAYDGPTGLDLALTGDYDAMILDVMLPGMDGFAVLRAIRAKRSELPVLMLTARSGLDDRVQGLECGADYYLPKPFQEEELVACLHAITRKRGDAANQALAFGDITLSKANVTLSCMATGQSVALGAKEYQLMELFLRNPRQVLGRETIVRRVWGYDDEAEYNNLAVYLSFLRKKLAFIGATVEIRAHRGIGYALEAGA